MMSESDVTIFLAGGGTGGHLYPGIAVAESLRASLGSRAKLVFLTTQRPIDRTILSPGRWEFVEQPIVPLTRSIGGLLKFAKSYRDTKDLVRKLLRERKPAAVLGLGGYAAGVAVKMAASRKIPTAILNPDVIPGKANKFLMRSAAAVCCQFEETRAHVSSAHHGKLVMTGCPIRSDLRTLPTRKEAAARLGLNASRNTLVITGASQGAQTVNEAILSIVGELTLHGWQILHLSGKDHVESVRKGYRDRNITDAAVVDFTPAMADVWAVADLCVTRAGASTCAELTACGVPSILMPYPFHKDMHQRANAKVLADAGAAVLLVDEKDAKKNAVTLKPALESLLHDQTKRKQMSDAARRLGKSDAADQVARVIEGMLSRR